MIAALKINGEAVARIDDDGKWRSNDTDLQRELNAMFPVEQTSLPLGVPEASRVASLLGADVEWGSPPHETSGAEQRVY